MIKDINLKIRLSKEENKILQEKAKRCNKNKSQYIRSLILDYQPVSNINYKILIELSNLWDKMKNQNIELEIINELKAIILQIQDDN